MAHPPQEILIKVPCSDRLPENTGYYHAVIKESEDCIYFNHITEYWYHSKYEITHVFPSHWYEPATRVVLTVEECEEIQKKINLLAADNRRLMAKHTNPYKY